MSIKYINDLICVVDEVLPINESLSAIDASLEKLLGVRTAKDLLLFLDQADAEMLTVFCLSSFPDEEVIDFLIPNKPSTIYGQDLSTLVGKCLPEAEYLDRWAIEDLGKLSEQEFGLHDGEKITLDVIKFSSSYNFFLTGPAADKIREIQTLARYAAIANGHSGIIEKITTDSYIVIYDKLSWYQEEHLPISSFRGNFDENTRRQIIKELKTADDKIEAGQHSDKDQSEYISQSPGSKIFIYPKGTTDREIALDIFAAYMNSFYASGGHVYHVENSFGVNTAEGKIRVFAKESPHQHFYHEIANLAAADRFAICPHCGNAFYRPTNRLNYCSDSCKTLASKERREKTLAFAYGGKPIEQAISVIGEEYTASIKKWYKEAQAITAQLAE